MKKHLLISLFLTFSLFTSFAYAGEQKIVHVIVPLCDNIYQAIAPVPAALGNGQDPAKNLYWGAMYGVKTLMIKQGWKLVYTEKKPDEHILERIVLSKHNVFIIADAYDGRYIVESIQDLYQYAGSNKAVTITNLGISGGGKADMLVFMGHNAFLDNTIKIAGIKPADRALNKDKQVSVFACYSRVSFLNKVKETGATPLLFTNGFMAPEAYILSSLVDTWRAGKSNAGIHEAVSKAYNTYQKSGINGARKLFYYE